MCELSPRFPPSKIMTREQALVWRRGLLRQQRRLVLTNGCFDILHRGHAEYLFRARCEGDALLVAINSDESIRQVKGPTRPIMVEADRAWLLAALEFVDAVVVFSERKPLPLFQLLTPDVYVKGGDYTIDSIDQEERRALEALGCRIALLGFVPGASTSALAAKLREEG